MIKQWCVVALFLSSAAGADEIKSNIIAAQKDSITLSLQHTKQTDPWLAKDKADHLIMSAFFAGLGYYGARKLTNKSVSASANLAASFSLTLGLSKEAYDKISEKGIFSLKDIVADIAGIFLGYLLLMAGTS
ncbi:hypothetical protein GF407_19105 [candidate division KSB1 bacterium]|nr:hypothetical protein [candidate division KSB1 bacterium]